MIAPCMCRGSSKWVHRSCLDQWRIHERDRAFSQCTECQFTYHMEAKGGEDNDHEAMWRRAKFTMLVSRDILVVTLSLQLIICMLGWAIYAIDSNHAIVDVLNGDSQHCDENTGSFFWCNNIGSAYYLCGLFASFVLLGLYGCVILSTHRCSIRSAFDQIQQQHNVENPRPTACSGHASSAHNAPSSSNYAGASPYISADRGTTLNSQNYYNTNAHYTSRNGDGADCGDCCYACCLGRRGRNSYLNFYYCPANSDCCCCDGDCPQVGRNGNSDNSNCGGETMHIVLVVLLVVAIVMAVVGFFVGLVIAVVIGQRIVQRHVFLLHKRRLVREFIVKDLEDYGGGVIPTAPVDRGDEEGAATAPPEHLDTSAYSTNNYGGVVTPSAPPAHALHRKDIQHLKTLGLMD
jgi:hypothetical protein